MVMVLFILCGCAIVVSPGISVKPEGFGDNKKYAVVTIAGTKKLQGQKGLLQMFKGDIPEVATLQVQAGKLFRTYEIPMGSEYYGSPDYPVGIANIWVKNNQTNGYEFEIYE